MEKISLPRRFRVYAPLIALFVFLVLMMPKSPKFSYDYRKGSSWMHETLIAQFDFPVLKTEQQFQQEREQASLNVIPYFRQDVRIGSRVSRHLSSMDFGEYQQVKGEVSKVIDYIYSKGIISPVSGQFDVKAYSNDGILYIQKDRRAVKASMSEVFTVDKADALLRETLYASCDSCNVDSLYAALGLVSLIEPDLTFDQQTTDLIQDEAVDYISTTQGVVRAGQVIVSNGEIVTAEIEQLLDSYKAEYNSNIGYGGHEAFQWLGNVLISLFLVFVLYLAIYYCNHTIFDRYNKYLYLLLIFTISAVVSFAVSRTDESLFYLVPFTLIALYLLAFFKIRMVFTVYVVSLLPMLIFAQNGMELFVMYLVAGVVCILVFGFFNRGWLQFVTALIVFVAMTIVWGAFRLTDGTTEYVNYHSLWYMFLGSMLSVAGYPLIYLFEKIFKLVSNSKLVELSDTSNTLLRQLADKAPGTFQHSLQVMNLADAAARSIDANVPLIRAGALYHDIGKINNPQCFTENETPGVNYHAGLSLKESAQEIIRHVSDGLALAEKHGLPDVLKEFIQSHHGTTCTGYFYTRYLNEGGDSDDVQDFYYDGVKPMTKEQVILMICDAVEAASRSLKDYSKESISALVDRIVDGKAADGQLSDSAISLRELNIVKDVIKTYIQQMYHSRVSYPKRKDKGRK